MRELGKVVIVAGVIGLALTLAAPPVSAANPCAGQVIKLCKGVKPGEGRVAVCLWAKRDQLTPECRAKAKADFKKWMQVSADCFADYRKFCSEVKPGGLRISACLLKNEASLENAACKAEVTKAREGLQSLVPGICLPDAKKFCKDVKPGEGRVKNCLKAHEDKLKPACRKKVKRWK